MFNLNTFILRLGAQFGSNDRNIKIEQMLPVEHEKFRVGYTHIVKVKLEEYPLLDVTDVPNHKSWY